MRILSALLLCMLLFGCAPASPERADILEFPAQTPRGETGAPRDYESLVEPDRTYTYEMLAEDAQELAAAYPDLIGLASAGRSVEGRELFVLKVGKGKTSVLLLGAHHAREYITAAFLMETADEYARAYKTGKSDVFRPALLEEVMLYILPMVNPDGVNLVQNGPDTAGDPAKVKAMRMLQDTYDEWKANINGVDLNRQYPCHWEEKASNTDVPSSEMYKGAAPATEPEVQAVMRLCEEIPFALAASFHTKGEVVYWADSGTEEAIAAAAPVAQSIADITGYRVMAVSEDPAVYGAGFENWFRQEYLRPGFCIELTPAGNGSLPHDDAQFDSLVWSRAKGLAAVLMQQALAIS